MSKAYKRYKYLNFRCRQMILLLLGLVVPAIVLLTEGEINLDNWGWVVIPIIVEVIVVIVLELMRRMLLARLLFIEIDVKTFAQLTKKPKSKKQELLDKKWETVGYYFDGDFEGVFSSSRFYIEKGDKTLIFTQRDLEIKSNFILGDYSKVLELIELQNQIKNEVNPRASRHSDIYYEFFTSFISGEYEKSISSLNTLLEDEKISKLNNIKISIYYFLRMAYKELGNEEQVEKCTQEIYNCDPRRLTFFTR